MSVNYAELVLGADTSGLRKVPTDLAGVTKAGAKTEASVTGSMKKVDKSFSVVGMGAAKMAAAATAAFGSLAAAASIGKAISMQLEFGSALAETSTLLNGNAAEMAKVEKASKSLAATYGGSATAQAQGFYQAISAGAGSAAQATELLDTANRLAIGGVTDVTTAVDILTTATNVYASEGLLAADASDALFVAMKAGKTTITELSSSLGKVLPLSQNLGVSFDETAGTVAALTKSGIATTEAVTGLRAAMTAVLGPSKEASDLAKELRIDFSAAGLKAQGLAEFMADVTAKTGGSSEAMQTLFSSVEATTVALSLSGAAGGFLSDILGDMAEKAGATSAAMALMADDDAQRLNVAMTNLNNIMLEFGAGALTALVPAVETAAGAAMLLAENIDVLGIGLGLMASTYIPGAITGLVSLSAWLATSEGLFIAGAIAAKGMSLAMAALPFAAVLAGATVLFRLKDAFSDASAGAASLAEESGILMDAQSKLDAVSVAYYNNVTKGSTQAMQAAAEAAKVQAEVALQAANELLIQQQRIDKLLVGGLFGLESPKTRAAREAVEALSAAVFDAEVRLSAADAATIRMNNSLIDAEASADGLAGASGLINFDGAVASAAELANWLGISLSRALALSATTPAMADEDAAMSQSVIPNAANREAQRQAVANYDRLTEALNKTTKASSAQSKAAKAAEKAMKDAAKETAKFAEEVGRMELDADPLKKYNEELERLEYLVSDHGLSDGAFEKYVKDLNDEFANSNPTISKAGDAIADFVAGGMRNFGDLLDSFKNMLKQMIATAIANPIKLALMGVGGGMAGTAAQAAGAAPGGGGMMGNLMGLGGGVGGIGSALTGGFMNSVGGFMSGGLSGGFGAIGAQVGTAFATGTGTAIAGAIGAVAAPLLAVAAVFSFFKKKTKELDSGMRVTVDGMDSLLESFRYVEESRFWGLSKKKKTYYDELSEEDAAPLEKVIHDLQTGILTTAEALNVGAGAFEAFSYQMKISTKDMSEEEAQAAIVEALQGLSDEFAGMVPGIADLQREGEGAATTLQRIVAELQTVNDALYLFDRAALEASVAGAAMASNLVELSGGLEAFTAKTQYVFANMLTGAAQEARLIEMAGDALRDTFGDLSMAIPSTHAQFMALLDAQDLTTQGGRETYAALMDVAQAFVTVNGTAQSVVDAAEALAEAQRNERLGLETELLQLAGETAELRRRELEAIDPANHALQEAIWAFGDLEKALQEFDKATDDQIKALQDKYSNAALEAQLSTVDGQIAAAKRAVEGFQKTQIDTFSASVNLRLDRTLGRLERAKDAASDALSILAGNLDSIRSAIASRGPIGFEQAGASYRSAQASLAGFAGGASYTPEMLERALSGVSVDTTSQFSSLQDMVIDAANTTATLIDLEGRAEDQVSSAEAAVSRLEYQITQAELAAERDIEFYKSSLKAFDDAESIYKTMDQALAALKEFTARREDIQMMIAANTYNMDREINQLSLLRSEMRQNIAATLGVSGAIGSLVSALTGGGTQAFASGGVINGATRMLMSGGMGVMGEAGPEAIMPLKRGPGGGLGVEMYGGPQRQVRAPSSNNDALIKEIAGLRSDLAASNKRIEALNKRTAQASENMDFNGVKERAG